MASIESRLRSLKILQTSPSRAFLPESEKTSFAPLLGIQDDHIPFMARGVEILHIIPNTFPSVWHTKNDDGPHLDMPTVRDWAQIVTAFVGEWMDLEGFFPSKAEAEAKIKEKRNFSKTEL